jgi:hypothetical protein
MRTGHLVLFRACAFGILVIVAFSHLARVAAQAPSTSDAAAVTALTNALNAIGGAAAWAQVSDVTMVGTCTASGTGNGSSGAQESFRWITQGGEFRYETSDSEQFSVLLSGHGSPHQVTPSGTQTLTNETALLLKPFHLPGLVFAAVLNDPHYVTSIAPPADATANSTVHVHVVRRLIHAFESGSEQDWWFDASTFLPLKVTYRIPGQSIRSYGEESYVFSAWTAGSFGVVIPNGILATSFGVNSDSCTATQVQINTNPAPSLFDAR